MEKIISNLLQDYEHGKISRRKLIQSLAVAVGGAAIGSASAETADGATSAFKATAVNHISYQVEDYAKTRDFYAGLLGMQPHNDDGKQCYLRFGDSVFIARNRPPNAPRIDHIAYTIENWNREAVEAELKRRGLDPQPDTENSFHVRDISGYDLQICGDGMKL